MVLNAPRAHNPHRMTWDAIPVHVRDLISERAGTSVVAGNTATNGFSPGFAGVLTFEDGSRLFLKVVDEAAQPVSAQMNRREAHIIGLLPARVPAPRLCWELDQEPWHILAFEAVAGEAADPVANASHREAIWEAVSDLASVSAPSELPPFHEYQWDVFNRWRALADAEDRAERMASLGREAPWIEAHLDRLLEWEIEAIAATHGDRLVHGDLRADNVLISNGAAHIVDWPHASRGAAWLDLMGYLPSFEMYGGRPAHVSFRAHQVSAGVSLEQERAVVAALAGYFTVQSTESPVPGIAGIREFQRAQARPALRWLRRLAE